MANSGLCEFSSGCFFWVALGLNAFYGREYDGLSGPTAAQLTVLAGVLGHNAGDFVRFQVCVNSCFLEAHLSQDLVFVVLSVVVSWSLCRAPPTAFPCGHWCTVGVLAGTHQCATESRVTLWQSANPSVCWLG